MTTKAMTRLNVISKAMGLVDDALPRPVIWLPPGEVMPEGGDPRAVFVTWRNPHDHRVEDLSSKRSPGAGQ